MRNKTILEKINQAALILLQPMDLDETYQIVAQEAKKLVGAEYGSVFIARQNRSLERIYATSDEVYKIKIRPEGFVYKSFLSGKPIILGEKDIPKLPKEIQLLRTKTVVLIPLAYKRKSIGVLSIFSKESKSINNEQVNLLKLFGSMATLAIKKNLLYQDTLKAVEEKNVHIHLESILKKIHNAGLKFLQPLTTEQTFLLITREAIKLLNAKSASLYLVKDGELQPAARIPSSLTIKVRRRGFTYRAYKERKIFIISPEGIQKVHPELRGKGYKSAICIPLSYYQKSIGSLMLLSTTESAYQPRELELLKIFGSYASLAIRKAQLHEEINKALETRDLFISMAAHELRTPLTAISGYTQLLKKYSTDTNSSQSRWVNELYWETVRLTSLVNEVLEVNRIKEGQLRYIWKELSIREILQRVINNFQVSNPHRKIIYKDNVHDLGDRIIGDSNKLSQVFTNILDNAVKFSSDDTEILLSLKSSGNVLHITIQDKGRGIEAADLSKIFQQFYRKAEEEKGGMGLGLFLAKNIIKIHHGSIDISSKPQRGTSVDITLPRII